ncbi:caspase recruitment domain-containing protein 8-like [Pagrus major]|uniref:caspase recruitment domain-containing protein 8-like n=1 Tax=Pagrus major TaxID=143350 RepID=UPI003CC87055
MNVSVKEEKDGAESPGSSRLPVKADGSKDHLTRFDAKVQYNRERPESAESGYVSKKRIWSEEYSPMLSNEPGSSYTKVQYNSPSSESGESGYVSMMSDGPKVHLPMFRNEPAPSETKKYTVISQRYREDFCTLYSEYQCLHAQLEDISTKLQNELEKQVQQIKGKKTHPNYTQGRKRLEDLHNKMENIKRSIAMYDLSHLRQFLPLGSHHCNVNRAPPDRHEQYPSTSESDLPVSDDIREESKENKVDQLCPDDPERSNQQHQLLCGEAQNTNDKQHFLPELLTESGKTSYRFRCSGPGVFQCELTGLVFVMVQEVELLYKTVQWDEGLLKSADKMAAGLLYDIKCSEDAAVCQLHLPHCEVMDAPLPEGLLSVVHITDDGMNVLEPLEVTDTHVVVTVSQFSFFGIVKNFFKWLLNKMRPVSGKVLLFLGQPNPETQRQKLNVFLLPRNIHLDEVSTQQRYTENIQVPSKCKLIEDQSYSLHCPQAIKIQPKSADFDLEFGPNYDPTFEVRLPTNTEEVTVTVKDQRQMVVWEHDVDLTDSRGRIPQRNAPAEQRIPAEQRLHLVRTEFVRRVSGPVLNQLLDKLLDLDFINDEEMQSVKAKPVIQDRARELIDTVRKKENGASWVLIAALRKVDPNLSRVLNLS